jgi:O-antigen/teichoic acid export membrane protein
MFGARQSADGPSSDGLARNGLWTALDQVLVSGTNFAGGILLARLCAPEEYGAFAVGFMTLMLLAGIQRALITDPLAVLGPGRDAGELRLFVRSLSQAQSWQALLLAAATAAAAAAVRLGGGPAETFQALVGTAVAGYFVLGQDYRRRILFTKLLPSRVLSIDAVFCSLYLAGVTALWRLGAVEGAGEGWLSARNALLVMAVASSAAMAWGSILVRQYVDSAAPVERRYWRESWQFGRWLLGDFIGFSLMVQGGIFAVAAITGNAQAAVFESARLVVGPLQILMTGGHAFLTPWAATQLADHGRQGLARALRPVAMVWVLAFIGYPMLVALTPKLWLSLFYGGRYDAAAPALVLWAGVYAALGLSQLPWIVVQVLRRPDLAMYSKLVVGALGLLLMVWMTLALGVEGAVGARLLGETVHLAIGSWLAWRLLRGGFGEAVASRGSAVSAQPETAEGSA